MFSFNIPNRNPQLGHKMEKKAIKLPRAECQSFGSSCLLEGMVHLHVTLVQLNNLIVTFPQMLLHWNYFISNPSFPNWEQFSHCQTPRWRSTVIVGRSVGRSEVTAKGSLFHKLLIMEHKTWAGMAGEKGGRRAGPNSWPSHGGWLKNANMKRAAALKWVSMGWF